MALSSVKKCFSESLYPTTIQTGLGIITRLGWNPLLFLLGIGMALGLFYYGINVPFALRLRGDAYQYMNIARQFTSLSDALYYMGPRTPGFPLFEYLFLYWDGGDALSIMNHICVSLLILHELTSLWICFVCVKLKLLKKNSIYVGALFLMLAAYPALIMHTTIPLTDVFGMDLLLVAFSMFVWTENAAKCRSFYFFIFLGIIAGGLLGYAILVRPAYGVGVLGFLVSFMLASMMNCMWSAFSEGRQSLIMGVTTILFLAAVILPVTYHCKAQYSTLCLEDPKGFPLLDSVNAGLIGAQTIWNYYPVMIPAAVPVFPDPFMVHHFHDRCHIKSLVGGLGDKDSSLLGCFYHAPGLTVVFFTKKIIGLFDVFRMTPYTEKITPVWYLWMSGLFSCCAFVGFWVLLIYGVKRAGQFIIKGGPVSPCLSAIWFFCIIQVSLHVILHVEERYAFPWIPFCLMALLFKIKDSQEKKYLWITQWLWLILGIVTMLIYIIQILIWDRNILF